MAEGESASPAAASAALFHFQKLTIELAFPSAEVFAKDGSVHASPQRWGLLQHEFTHYLQGVSTVLGQRIVLNWIATAVGSAQALVGVEPLLVPLQAPAARRNPGIDTAYQHLNGYFAEVNALVGARHPLRPAAEANCHDVGALYEYRFTHPDDSTPTTGTAVSLATKDGTKFGVPVLGDALTEGMAQAVQWRASRQEFTDALLDAPPLDPAAKAETKPVYYTAVAQAVRRRLPRWDPVLTTIVFCDAALCSRYPGGTLAYIFDGFAGKPAPNGIGGYRALRRELDGLKVLRDSRAFILGEIEAAEAGIPPSTGGFAPLLQQVLGLMRRTWRARATDPAILVDEKYGPEFFQQTVTAFEAPPIFFSDKTHLVAFAPDELLKAFHFLRASYEILAGLYVDGLAAPCSILRSQLCGHRKTEKCRTDLLSIPTGNDGRACHIAFAAHELALYGRTRRRV